MALDPDKESTEIQSEVATQFNILPIVGLVLRASRVRGLGVVSRAVGSFFHTFKQSQSG
jgi:hypothetical protein